jgi:hypothetical protein
MQSDISTLPDDCRIVSLRDVAEQCGVTVRTLKLRLREHGVPIVAITPRRPGVRHLDFLRYLQACEL